MGEYIMLDGRDYKLGTCEDLYYCRYTDLAAWVRAGRAMHADGNQKPAAYLTDGRYRFRFPFPDEDGDEAARLAHYEPPNWDRGVVVPAPTGLGAGVEHLGIAAWVKTRDAEYGFNVFLPCPADAARWTADYSHSQIPYAPRVEVVRQKPVNGQLWTVLRCQWCAAMWRIDADEAARLHDHICQHDWAHAELARRILAGYEPGALAQ